MARKPRKNTPKPPSSPAPAPSAPGAGPDSTHLKVGWLSILVFLCLGIGLEALHGFKVPWYLDPAHETRRLMFTLAHAHGVLLGLVNLAYAFTAPHLPPAGALRGRLLIAATVLLPGGFALGGLFTHGADPGVGIFLLPLGALALLTSVAMTVRGVFKR